MENQGWISLHRKILDNPIFYDSSLLQFWLYILLKCNYEDKYWIYNFEKIQIKKGQCVISQRKVALELKCSISKINRMLKYLKSETQIETRTDRQFTLIEVLNWDRYQKSDTPFETQKEHKENTKRTQKETNNNVNNVNNENKERAKMPNPQILELKKYLEEKIGTLDGNTKENGQYCYNLIRKMAKDYPAHDPVKSIKLLIDKGLQDSFHAQNITSFKYLYYNTKKIIGAVLQKKSNYIAV